MFLPAFFRRAKTAKLGHSRDAETVFGPFATPVEAQRILDQVSSATSEGATLVLGEGEAASELGGLCYVPPHMLTDVANKMAIMSEETLGPAASILEVRSDR